MPALDPAGCLRDFRSERLRGVAAARSTCTRVAHTDTVSPPHSGGEQERDAACEAVRRVAGELPVLPIRNNDYPCMVRVYTAPEATKEAPRTLLWEGTQVWPVAFSHLWAIADVSVQRSLFSKYPDARKKSMADIEKAVKVRCHASWCVVRLCCFADSCAERSCEALAARGSSRLAVPCIARTPRCPRSHTTHDAHLSNRTELDRCSPITTGSDDTGGGDVADLIGARARAIVAQHRQENALNSKH